MVVQAQFSGLHNKLQVRPGYIQTVTLSQNKSEMGGGGGQLAPSKILTEAVQPVSILHNVKVYRQITEAFG